MRVAILSTILALCAAVLPVSAQAIQQSYQLNIPRQPLDGALKDLAQQTGLQIARFSDTQGGTAFVGPVSGDMSVGEALTSLLSTSGLTYRVVNDRTIAVIAQGAEKGEPSAAARSAQATPSEDTDRSKEGKKNSSGAFLLAQVDQASTGPQVTEQSKERKPPAALEEVVVTGSHIPGVLPTSPLLVIDQQAIEDSGLSSVGEVIRDLPENFSGGRNPGIVGGPGVNNQNTTNASSPNLRGLGSNATLTLVDGHRLALNGFNAGSDISAIPIAAVAEIQILTDGASAVYGSDAVGGVVNFRMKSDYKGVEASARVGGAPDGGAFQQLYSLTAGHMWTSGNLIVSYEHGDTSPLLASQRPFTETAPDPQAQALLQRDTHDTVFLAGRQELTGSAAVFLDGIYGHRTSEVQDAYPGFNVFGPQSDDAYSVTPGLKFTFPIGWTGEIYATLSSDTAPYSQYLSFPPSTTPILSASLKYINTTRLGEAHVAGPVGNLGSGDITMAVGAGYRQDTYALGYAPPMSSSSHSGKRSSPYAYAELYIPIVRQDDRRTGLNSLAVSAAGRYERYSDFGVTTNPKLGLVYKPIQDVTAKFSWGTSFTAPSFEQEVGQRLLFLFDAPATVAPAPETVLMRYGANASLGAETSTAYTLNLSYSPRAVPGLTLGATGYRINFRNQINPPFTNPAIPLENPAAYGGFITLDPTAADQQSLFAYISPGSFFNRSSYAYTPANVYAVVDARYQNLSKTISQGLDLTLAYKWVLTHSRVDFFGSASHIDISQTFFAGSPSVGASGLIFTPPSWRGRLGATWSGHELGATLIANYISSEENNLSSLRQTISPWTTVDAQLTYTTPDSRWFSGLVIRVSAQNVFNRRPPGIAADSATAAGIPGILYDSVNASAVGRVVSGQLVMRW